MGPCQAPQAHASGMRGHPGLSIRLGVSAWTLCPCPRHPHRREHHHVRDLASPAQPAACLRLTALWTLMRPLRRGWGRPPSGPVCRLATPPMHYIQQRHIPCASCMWLRSGRGGRVSHLREANPRTYVGYPTPLRNRRASSHCRFVQFPCLFAFFASQNDKSGSLPFCLFV